MRVWLCVTVSIFQPNICIKADRAMIVMDVDLM